MEYIILEESNSDLLEKYIMRLLKEGYKLQGGVSTHYDTENYSTFYSQAVIKYLK